MRNPSDERPVTKVVLTAKKFVVFLGILCLVGGFILCVTEDIAAGIGVILSGIGCFLVGGLIAGFAAITQAALVYIERETEQWKQEQERAEAEKAQAEDDVIDYLIDMVE